MVIATNLGFPCHGAQNELPRAIQAVADGAMDADALALVAADLRREHWTIQHRAGIKRIPSHDFSLSDPVMEMLLALNALPKRFGAGGGSVTPLKTKPWFGGKAFSVPEWSAKQQFGVDPAKSVAAVLEAKSQGIHTRPVLIGPVSLLLWGKKKSKTANVLDLLPGLLAAYTEWLQALADAGADWVQLDEPFLTTALSPEAAAAYATAYEQLAKASKKLHLLVAAYGGGLGDNTTLAVNLPVDGLHIDLINEPEQLDAVLAAWPGRKALSLGVVDGSSPWRAALKPGIKQVQQAIAALGGEWIQVAPSCPLYTLPVDSDTLLLPEIFADSPVRHWLCGAKQKLLELGVIVTAATKGRGSVLAELEVNQRVCEQMALVDEATRAEWEALFV